MSDILKGVLGGGWALLVGWIMPSAVTVVAFRFLVAPSVPAGWLTQALRLDVERQGLALLGAAILLGLLLAAVQVPLYRLAEGYVGWHPRPAWSRREMIRHPVSALLDHSHRRQLDRKHLLVGRRDFVELSQLAEKRTLRPELMKRLAQVRADPRLKPYVEAGWEANLAHLGLLKERARRYPVDDGQVLPTRLGNAIRRLEEYGYDRYRLDSQLLWYELNSSAPAEARKFADQARTTLDFLICLLYGNLMVAAAAIAALGWAGRERITLGVAAVILIAAAALWYRVAVVVTDDWAASVRALVNLGRKPLASSMGLDLPSSLADERDMWAAVSRVAARPYDDLSAQLDPFRAPPADTSLHVDWRRDTPSATDGDGRLTPG